MTEYYVKFTGDLPTIVSMLDERIQKQGLSQDEADPCPKVNMSKCFFDKENISDSAIASSLNEVKKPSKNTQNPAYTIEGDIQRACFVPPQGQSALPIIEQLRQTTTLENFSYTQGNFNAANIPMLSMQARPDFTDRIQKNATDPLFNQLSFVYLDDQNKYCGFSCIYLRDDSDPTIKKKAQKCHFSIAIIRNVDKVPNEKDILFIAHPSTLPNDTAPEDSVITWQTAQSEILAFTQSKTVNKLIQPLFEKSGGINTAKHHQLDNTLLQQYHYLNHYYLHALHQLQALVRTPPPHSSKAHITQAKNLLRVCQSLYQSSNRELKHLTACLEAGYKAIHEPSIENSGQCAALAADPLSQSLRPRSGLSLQKSLLLIAGLSLITLSVATGILSSGMLGPVSIFGIALGMSYLSLSLMSTIGVAGSCITGYSLFSALTPARSLHNALTPLGNISNCHLQ